MEAVNQFLADEGQEKFEKARILNDEESKNDPESEPYKSKYKAREILSDLRETVEKYQGDDPENSRWTYLLAAVHFKLGSNYAETEELGTGEEHLKKCEELLEENKMNKYVCSLYFDTLNQLGILWTGRRYNDKALDYLCKAESLYKDYKHEVGSNPLMVTELLQPETEAEDENIHKKREDAFEDIYTHTLYYLAQVHGKIGESQKSAEYCHETLHRQLDTMKYTPRDWALNCATLSQYYITMQDFTMARHCMAASSTILKECGDPGPYQAPTDEMSQEEIDQNDLLPRMHSDIARCWAKYGLQLLETSMDKLLTEEQLDDDDHNEDINQDQKEDDDEKKKKKNEEDDEEAQAKKAHEENKKSALFFNLEVTSVEEQITDKYLQNFEQAREAFLCVQKWLNQAKEYYALDGHCSDHVEIMQDLSKAYKFLAFFEPSFDRQCKMHKRRVDLLSALQKELNPQYYLLVCRQLMFEAAESYSSILDLKLAMIEEEGGTPNFHAIKKINQLAENSIAKYKEYIDSLKTSEKILPDRFSNDDERPALVAHFCMGTLFSKFIHPDVNKRLACMNQSLQYYKFLVDYVKKNPESEVRIKAEHDICKEMALLLPAKMDRVRASAEI